MNALSKTYQKEDFKISPSESDCEVAANDFKDGDALPQVKHASLTSLLKRGIDIVLSGTALFFLLPLYAFIAIAIRLQDGGSVLFVQKRIGLDGVGFNCLKFRTMINDAEERLASVLEKSADARHEWETMGKLTNDPRITWIGNFLRKTSLDELPQLVNVLLGEMSLVGPRPIVTAEIAKYGEDFDSYIAVRPGVSGLWQVSGRSDVGFDQRVQMDKRYATEWSTLMDLSIILRTIPTLLARKGAR